MNVQTKEFWLKVKEEYRPGIGNFYICRTSGTFKEMWNNIEYHRQDHIVVNNGVLFLKEIENYDFVCNDLYLFCNNYCTEEDHIEIRIQFIDHMINKYQ